MNAPQPPHWAKILLRWLHPHNTLEEVDKLVDALRKAESLFA